MQFVFKTRKKPRGRRRCAFLLLLLAIVLYVGAITLPYVQHKQVSEGFLADFDPQQCYSDAPGTERFAYIDDNVEALVYRLKLIREAQSEIILSTFQFGSDNGGRDLMAALLDAARRGVKVRAIVDGFSGLLDMQGDPWFLALASHENVSMKVYNPITPLKPWKMQARLHDKYLIIDHSAYLLGGRNSNDLFLGDYSAGQNIDRELFVMEASAAKSKVLNANSKAQTTADTISPENSLEQLRSYFEAVWSLPDSRDFVCKRETKRISAARKALEQRWEELPAMYGHAWEPWDWDALTYPANRITLLSNPIQAGNKEPWIWEAANRLMRSGSDILVYTPYIILGKEMYADLARTRQQAERLDIITNDVSSGANPWGCTDYLNEKENIWATGVTGVRVYEFMGTHSLHTKAILIDERMTLIGSYNWDMRSTYQDTELMLAVDSPELNRIIRAEAEQDMRQSRYMGPDGSYINGPDYQPRTLSAGKKCFYAVLRVLIKPIRYFL